MKRKGYTREIAVVAACVALAVGLVLITSTVAWARPGGGQSFSGSSKSSSSGSSGGGSGGGGDLIVLLIELCFEFPQIGIPLLIVAVIVILIMKRKNGGEEWATRATPSSDSVAAYVPPGPRAPSSLRERLKSALLPGDPPFSLVVFEDFVYFLYAEVQRARGEGKIDFLAPYVDERVRASLRGDGRLRAVSGIIIGAIEYEAVDVSSDAVTVRLLMDVNYVEHAKAGGDVRYYAKERLTVRRALVGRSRTPDTASILACPNCGAPLASMRGTTCAHCNTVIIPGQKDWAVVGLDLLDRETRGPLLTSSVDETGTNLPTLFDPTARAAMEHLARKDPAFQFPKLEARVRHVFSELQAGWTERDPKRIRPFMSDNLFQSQVYFLDAYRAARAINRLDGALIERVELVRVASDAFYDAITVRLYASSLDYTISEDGKVLSGNPKKPRRYSEYWTLIRGSRAGTRPTDDRACPNCGAPLSISMVGNCTYCNAKVTTGLFDWVLSRIEQDEAYRG